MVINKKKFRKSAAGHFYNFKLRGGGGIIY